MGKPLPSPRLGRKVVACVACGRVLCASKNGHPRRHSPHNRLMGKRAITAGTCDGTFLPGAPA